MERYRVLARGATSPDLVLFCFPSEAREAAARLVLGRPPYVVRNADGGRIGYWVPWREGNSTRAARHGDLLRVLIPVQSLPDVEILWASVSAHEYVPDGATDPLLQWWGTVDFYAAVPELRTIVFPAHRVRSTLHLGDAGSPLRMSLRSMGPGSRRSHPLMDVSQQQLVLRGAGSIRVDVEANSDSRMGEELVSVRMSIELGSPGTVLPVAFDVTLTADSPLNGREDTRRWTFDRDLT